MNISLLNSTARLIVWLGVILVNSTLGLGEDQVRGILLFLGLFAWLNYWVALRIKFCYLTLWEIAFFLIVLVDLASILRFGLARHLYLVSYLILSRLVRWCLCLIHD